jgi:hypothetical protein
MSLITQNTAMNPMPFIKHCHNRALEKRDNADRLVFER